MLNGIYTSTLLTFKSISPSRRSLPKGFPTNATLAIKPNHGYF